MHHQKSRLYPSSSTLAQWRQMRNGSNRNQQTIYRGGGEFCCMQTFRSGYFLCITILTICATSIFGKSAAGNKHCSYQDAFGSLDDDEKKGQWKTTSNLPREFINIWNFVSEHAHQRSLGSTVFPYEWNFRKLSEFKMFYLRNVEQNKAFQHKF